MIDDIYLTLPLPHKCLQRNSTKHGLYKAKHIKKARGEARVMLRKLISDLPRSKQKELPREGIVIMVDFYFPTKRKRDSDNLIGWMKHYFDGFADAGIVSDDEDIIALPPRKYQDKKNPRVEFQIMDSTGLKLVFNLVDPDKLD